MIKSTKSESVSIAHYDFQNVRRESLLSQNWAASEEEKGTNAMSNTEEENMNALLFVYEMIKISINEELNAWITANETDNIIIFIKYMLHQHDIEIKIHNDMIQMLEDVNEINIMLKITQTRLQKEIKDKNMIIHHLETASSQQSTSIFEDHFLKSIKLLNLSLFEDLTQNVDNWLFQMQNKLKINKNHFSIEELKIAYIESWVSEAAIKHIASCMQNIFLNSFLEVEEVLLIINKMYDDFNHHHMTQQQYLKLYQNKIFFHEFWMKFQRFNAELEYNNETLLNNLQRATLNKQITNLNEFIDICMQVDVRLTELNARSVVKASATQAAHSVSSTLTTRFTSSVFSWKRLRRLNLNSIQKELFKKELCFKCKKSKQKAYDCFKMTQVHEIIMNLKNDLSSSK
jgi:hypothetical protein